MSLRSEVQSRELWGRQVAFRPAAAIAATPTNLFTVVGGAVVVTNVVVRLVTAITTAVTWHLVACGVALDAALFAAIGAIGTCVTWPFAGAANVAPAAVSPSPSLLTFAAGTTGVVVSPGAAAGDNFVLTYAIALIDGNTEWSVEYYRLSPIASIIPV